MNNFWNELKKPIFALAPMEDVTDTVFREVVMSVANPEYLQVLFAEFTSTDGLMHEVGRDKVIYRLLINDSEREYLKKLNIKLVAQIWGSNPEKYYKATKFICEEMDFDGIDINMGCPVKKIVKNGACSDLIKTPVLAKEILLATKEASNIPVSVKTRTGINQHITEEWMGHLLETKPTAITLHGRTQKQMSKVAANWDEIKKAAKFIKEIDPSCKFLGNGDVESVEDGLRKIELSGADGVMVGRGIFSNPWFFMPEKKVITPEEKLRLLWKHAKLFEETWNGTRNFAIIRRFVKIYTTDFYNAADIRAKLMETNNATEVRKVLEDCQYSVFEEKEELAESK